MLPLLAVAAAVSTWASFAEGARLGFTIYRSVQSSRNRE